MRFNNISIIWKISILLLMLGGVSISGALFAGKEMSDAREKYDYLMDGPQAASLQLARSIRMSFRAGIAMLNNVNAVDPAAVAQSNGRMTKEITDALRMMDEAAQKAPTFATDILAAKQKTAEVLQTTCGDIVRAAEGARRAGDMTKVIDSMRTVCSAKLDEVADASVELNRRLATYVDETQAEIGADLSLMKMIVASAIILATLAVLALAVIVVRTGIVRPIGVMIGTMTGLGRGELDKKVDGTERKDEIGNLANGLELLRTQLQDAESVRRENAAREEADRQKLAKREKLAQSFVANMQGIAGQFAQSSGEVAGAARNLSATAEETSRQAQAVAAAAEQAASNVQTVAASSEELAASVREISGRVFHSAEVANVAFREAEASNARIAELAQAAKAIGDVISLIKGIADQTNLLALNATIESARAGEAGKGFAVVASEVKELASQTAKATDDIAAKVTEIQQATDGTVASMAEIIRVVGDIKTISTTIAGAVEEQGAATGEIAQNCQQAATGTQQVTENIGGVGRAAEMTGAASSQLLSLSEGLSRQAGDLRHEVETFVTQLQAA